MHFDTYVFHKLSRKSNIFINDDSLMANALIFVVYLWTKLFFSIEFIYIVVCRTAMGKRGSKSKGAYTLVYELDPIIEFSIF